MAKNIAFVFARGGSKGLPNKNIREFKGKPLIAYSIDFALNSKLIDDVVVSTDSEEIAEIAKKFGATVPFLRPSELAQDSSPEAKAWQHAAGFYSKNIQKFDCFLSLPAVSPLRLHSDLEKILQKLNETEADFAYTAVKSDANPYFNLVEETSPGIFSLCKKSNAHRRQDVRSVFQIIPLIYAAKYSSVMDYNGLFEGKTTMIEIPKSRAIDIDDIYDFKYLEAVSNNIESTGQDIK